MTEDIRVQLEGLLQRKVWNKYMSKKAWSLIYPGEKAPCFCSQRQRNKWRDEVQNKIQTVND